MKHSLVKLIAILALCAFAFGCAAHTHVVGNGGQGTEVVKARQWYILFGLIPINTVNTNAMAGTADYTIKTEQSFLDIVLNFFTGIASVNSRTVTVKK